MAARGPAAAFVAERAWALLLAQTALGARYPGSSGHAAMRDWLRGALASHVDEVLLQDFSYVDPQAGKLALTNVIGVQGAARPRKLLLAAHWDTRPRADNDPQPARRDTPILGANDGASGVAVLLEIARVLQAQPPRVGVIYAFFDGEDWGFPGPPAAWPPGSLLLGSCYYAAHVIPERPGWGILLDMVGGRNLALLQEGISLASAPHLVNRVWSAGWALGHALFRPEPGQQVLDDHVPLIRAGIPMVNLVDQAYPAWHTTADTPEQCDPRPLEAVGQTVLRVVYEEPG